MSSQDNTSGAPHSLSEFGPNEWIVEEMYQRYLTDPASVGPTWHEFFADYQPSQASEDPAPSAGGTSAATTGSVTNTKPKAEAASTNNNAPKAQPKKTPSAPPAKPTKETVKQSKPSTERSSKKADGGGSKETEKTPLRGVAKTVAANMDRSLEIPTATSVRAIPAKLLSDNRIVINNHLKRGRGGKVSFTHLIGYALLKALTAVPEMNNSYTSADGKPTLVEPGAVNLGLAIDLKKDDGSRTLVVPSIKNCQDMDFSQFWQAYEDIVRKARNNKLTMDDHTGATLTLTNPGGIGTVHSVPRLMVGQGTIIGVGAMEYPAQFAGASDETISEFGVSKTVTVTSTYDHRIIQGAQSGEFLKRMHELLLGADDFYDEIFTSLRIPYEPVRWVRDVAHTSEGQIDKTARVVELIHAYRVRGHLMADTDPLEYEIRRHPDLDILEHGLTLWDLDRAFPVGGFAGEPTMKLRDILGVLRESYCRRVGIEYMHIQEPEERAWIQERVERPYEKPETDHQKHILGRLNVAEAFETFLGTKYVGQKRFSLEGGESLIPLLDEILSDAARASLDEVVIGMSHRGRLNVLSNIVGKPPEKIFSEFEGSMDPRTVQGSGDVKYHLGMTGKFTTPDGENATTVSVVANPSHLEAVDPVLEGIVRAKQDRLDLGLEGYTVLPLLVHGDAAFAGQGVVAETLNLSQLRGYRTGGTVHVIVNNQVGFTTAPEYSRSSLYSTDVARMIQAPIFHVNGDDPEAVVRVAKLAFEYRQTFNKDVVIDMLCYRRRGHNEGDDPSMTNPLMYQIIDAKRSVRKLYTEALIGRGDITLADAEEALKDYQSQLERVFTSTKQAIAGIGEPTRTRTVEPEVEVDTSVDASVLKRVGEAQTALPEGFTPHKRVNQVLQRRATAAVEGNIDWAFGELLAFGSLLSQGVSVRLAGQDSRRGTFVQRHSVIVDHNTAAEYVPLATVATTADDSGCTTRCSASSQRWASSTATPSKTPTPWCVGRPSSVTSPTAPSRSWTSSFPRVKPSGDSAPALFCCCHTVTRVPDPTTRRGGPSVTCSCAPRTTCASPTARHRPTTSTCCAARRCRRRRSRWSCSRRSRCFATRTASRRLRTSPTVVSSPCSATRRSPTAPSTPPRSSEFSCVRARSTTTSPTPVRNAASPIPHSSVWRCCTRFRSRKSVHSWNSSPERSNTPGFRKNRPTRAPGHTWL